MYKEIMRKDGKGYSKYVRNSWGKKGVYLICSKRTKEPLYIGMSGSNVYKTMTRHLQRWDDPTQQRTTYKNRGAYLVRIVFTNTEKQAERLEKALIIKHRPRDNPDKLEQYTEKDIKAPEKKEVEKFLGGKLKEPLPF